AVFAFEIISFFTSGSNNVDTLLLFFFGSALAVLLGWFSGRSLGWMFETGHIPEFLKSPAVFVVVIFSFTLPDELVHGTGLLSVLLISAIFIMLASSLNLDTILHIFNPHIIGYVLLMMFVVRPLSIFISTIGTGLTTGEKSLVGWIAPRGIVALTVSSYFANI